MTDAGKFASGEAGKWLIEKDAFELIKLIKHPGERLVGEINSIPSVYAHALMFKMAFNDQKNHWKSRYIDEWRGLLAIFALRNVLDLPIEVKIAHTVDETNLMNIYRDLRPSIDGQRDLKGATWEDIVLFRYEGEEYPFAMASPYTIVCGPGQYNMRLPEGEKIPWLGKDFRLQDPTKSKGLNKNNQQFLANWLDKLRNNVKDVMENQLDTMIKEYRKDLNVVSEDHDCLDDARVLDTIPKHYAMLSKAVKPNNLKLDSEYTAIMSFDDPKFQNVAFIDDGLADSYPKEVTANSIYVDSNHKTLNEAIGDMKKGIISSDRISPEEIFLGKIVLLESRTNIGYEGLHVKCVRDGENPVYAVFPLKDRAMDVFPVEYLRDNIEIKSDSPNMIGEISVSLKIVLNGPGVNKIVHTCRKIYKAANFKTVKMNSAFALQIFPNFKAKEWKENYSFQTINQTDKIIFEINGKDKRHLVDKVEFKQQSVTNVVTKYDEINEFVDVIYRDEDTRSEEVVGKLLFKQGILSHDINDNNSNVQMQIAIDFGTTGTMAYYRRVNSQEIKPIEPRGMVANLLKDEKNELLSRLAFIGAKDIMPINSTYVRKNNKSFKGKDSNSEDSCIVVSGNYANIRPLDMTPEEITNYFGFDGKPMQIYRDLKWSNISEEIKNREKFLESLLLVIISQMYADGYRKFKLFFSYPTAMADNVRNQYMDACRLSMNTLKQNISGIEFIDAIREKVTNSDHTDLLKIEAAQEEEYRMIRQSESIATASYFSKDIDIATMRSLMIDIGGGTTDVSYWINNSQYPISFKLAGRDIFTSLLARHQGWTMEQDFLVAKDAANILLRSNDRSFLALKYLITFGVVGLFYQIGEQYRKGNLADLANRSLGSVSMYLGGRGSNILLWVNPSRTAGVIQIDVVRLIDDTMMLAANPHWTLQDVRGRSVEQCVMTHVVISKEMKHEVAMGMLNDSYYAEQNSLQGRYNIEARRDFTIGCDVMNSKNVLILNNDDVAGYENYSKIDDSCKFDMKPMIMINAITNDYMQRNNDEWKNCELDPGVMDVVQQQLRATVKHYKASSRAGGNSAERPESLLNVAIKSYLLKMAERF